jgi:hypothetical protein
MITSGKVLTRTIGKKLKTSEIEEVGYGFTTSGLGGVVV